MKISVIIPVRNGAKFLERCVNSVLEQKLEGYELEVIIQDNMSTDGSKTIAKSFRDNRVHFFEAASSLSAGSNWTDACRKATGDFIKLLPVDDTLLPGALYEQAQALCSLDDIAFVSSWRLIAIENGGALPKSFGSLLREGLYEEGDILALARRDPKNFFGEPACILFRATVLRKSLPWRDSAGYAMDLDLYLRSLKFGKALVLEEWHSTFQITPGSISNKSIDNQVSATKQVIVEFLEHAGLALPPRSRLWASRIVLRGYLRRIIYFLLFRLKR